jgi:hypothetical protein
MSRSKYVVARSAPFFLLTLLSWALFINIGFTREANREAPTVVALSSPADPGSGQPHLALDHGGGLLLSWQAVDGEVASLNYSRFKDGAWSAPVKVAQGDNWFVNWADFPAVQPMPGGALAAHWLVRHGQASYAYDVWMNLSRDGLRWRRPFITHQDGTATEHGFVSLFSWQGHAGAVWLDGRQTAGGGHEHSEHDAGGMTLRYGLFDSHGKAVREGLVDELVCDCCQTDVALSGDALVLAYRDRDPQELRDVSVRRYDGSNWSAPVAVDDQPWTLSGCPVNGPAITANGENVAVAWYTGAAGTGQVKAAVSRDGGRSFGAPVMVDADSALGRVDIAWLDGDDLAVSWMDKAEGDAELKVMRLKGGLEPGEPLVVTRMSSARRSGFPQMVMLQDQLVFAWTDLGTLDQVKLARLQTDAL